MFNGCVGAWVIASYDTRKPKKGRKKGRKEGGRESREPQSRTVGKLIAARPGVLEYEYWRK